jgi:hypothetical protein
MEDVFLLISSDFSRQSSLNHHSILIYQPHSTAPEMHNSLHKAAHHNILGLYSWGFISDPLTE